MEIKPIQRDSNGLITGIEYHQTPEGLIDWRKMIKPEFLVPNRQIFEKNKKPVPEKIDGLEDKELLILLSGIKWISRLRGFTDVRYNVISPSPDYVAATCHMTWIPNFETENQIITSGSIADAHPGSTNSFGQIFLAAIAENRAFVRCVRNFLNINIVGQDEITPPKNGDSTENILNPITVLEKVMSEKNVSFLDIKAKLVSEDVPGAVDFQGLNDIPKMKIFELIDRLKRKKS